MAKPIPTPTDATEATDEGEQEQEYAEVPGMTFSASLDPGLDLILIAFGGILAIGGTVGYMQAGSTMSLVMGVGSGVYMLLMALLTMNNPRSVPMLFAIIAAAFVLTGVMSMRYIKTRTFFPAGWMLLNSAAMGFRYGERLAMVLMLREQDRKSAAAAKVLKSQ
ncbi:transmembrane proteins 14C-domain-containing protein [Blastocladiella britannica]|nr:transmembrane proteins 14C-domain-containing protein [Blastocladiella britannica]